MGNQGKTGNQKLLDGIEVLQQDENLLMVNKPAGLIVHSDGRTKEETLVDWVLEKYPEIKGVGEPWQSPEGETILRSGIVHRLDRETSGVMVIAKNQNAFEFLKGQFKERGVEKTYHAFVYGEIKEERGEIDRSIGRSAKDFRLWSAQRGARGKLREALTEYRVLRKKDRVSLVEAKPHTGRTHQIRVHFKAINHPVVCDKLYAPKKECVLGFNRLALHSHKIKFKDLDDQELEVEAPYPDDFQEAFRSFDL